MNLGCAEQNRALNIRCVETSKVPNEELLATTAYNNFSYLTEWPELMHSKKDIIEVLNSSNPLCYFVYDDDKWIGYMIGDFRTLPCGRYGYYISYIFVSQDYRNKKIGSWILSMLIDKCKTDGTKYIVLTCDTTHTHVVQFYKSMGFKVDSMLGDNFRRHNVFSLNLGDI